MSENDYIAQHMKHLDEQAITDLRQQLATLTRERDEQKRSADEMYKALENCRTRTESFGRQLGKREKEIERLKQWQMDVEEREASVCPEDVGFEDFIGVLNKRIDQYISQLTAAEQQVAALRGALARFVSYFETDFVLDGKIVDEPEKQWPQLVTLYNIAKTALTPPTTDILGCKIVTDPAIPCDEIELRTDTQRVKIKFSTSAENKS